LIFRGSNEKQGLLSLDGSVVCHAQYDSIDPFSEGLAIVRKGNRYGAIDADGNLSIPLQYAWLSQFTQDLSPAGCSTGSGGDGYIDKDNNIRIPFCYSKTFPFSEDMGMILTKHSNLFGFLHPDGAEALPPEFAWSDSFSNGLAAASIKQGKIGFIDHAGRWIIEPAYKSVGQFSYGVCSVTANQEESTWGYIDKTGDLIIPEKCIDAGPFKNGLALVHTGEKDFSECSSFYINERGEIVWGPGDNWYPC
jgi:hypothetical protein